jgi:hypothetical protein
MASRVEKTLSRIFLGRNYKVVVLSRTGDGEGERAKERGQARTQASDENLRDRE